MGWHDRCHGWPSRYDLPHQGASLIFENLLIKRVAVHEVYKRTDDRKIVAPTFAESLETLDHEAMRALRQRSTEALAGKSIPMRVAKSGADSFVATAHAMLKADDQTFLDASKLLANRLAEAQLQRSLPGGMLIVFDGTVGAPAAPFIGVIKAETQAAFRRTQASGKQFVEFFKDVFLTPAARLYKIGIMVRTDEEAVTPNGWSAHVFDRNIATSNREAAAAYFYDNFLGCEFVGDGPYETMRFFNLTKEFIRESSIDLDKKRDVLDSLYVFVRDVQEPTFTASEFGEQFLPLETRDEYLGYLEHKHFTTNAVVRDISLVKTRLRRRKISFGNDVELLASPEALQQKVSITPIEGTPVDGQVPMWTEIIIRQAVTGQD
jgi:hypothetical protein